MRTFVITLLILSGCATREGAHKGGAICKTLWNWSTQNHHDVRYVGSAICGDNNTLFAIFSREGDIQIVSPGLYPSAQTGLPCDFTVDAACGIVDTNTVYP